jgi:hypothetical protein
MRLAPLALLLLASLPAWSDVAPDLQAKFLKVIATHASSKGRVAVTHEGIKAELEKLGVSVDASANVAFAGQESELKAFVAAKKIVVCGRIEWLPQGASIAILEENGKPAIYMHTGNLEATGVKVSPAILRIGRGGR